MIQQLTAIIRKEEDMYTALCPELDVASQGETIEKARDNLSEAVSLFFECASDEEKQSRFKIDTYITPLAVQVG